MAITGRLHWLPAVAFPTSLAARATPAQCSDADERSFVKCQAPCVRRKPRIWSAVRALVPTPSPPSAPPASRFLLIHLHPGRNRNSTASRARLPSAADSAPRAPAPTPADTPLRAGVAADKLRKRPLPLEHVAAAPSAAPVGEVAPMAPRAMETSPRQTSARKKPTPGANTPAVAGRAEASSEKRRRTPLSQRFRQNAALLDSNAEAQVPTPLRATGTRLVQEQRG